MTITSGVCHAVVAQYSGSMGNGTAFLPSQAMAQLQLTQSCGEHGLLSKARFLWGSQGCDWGLSPWSGAALAILLDSHRQLCRPLRGASQSS